MRIRLEALSVLLILSSLPALTSAQAIKVDSAKVIDGHGGYMVRWDGVQDVLLMYRDIGDPNYPAVRMFKENGTDLALYPLRDLDGGKYIDTWDLAATPSGGVAMIVVVGYQDRNVKPAQVKTFLLTYDSGGKLAKVWDTEPYQHFLLASDRDGDVFAFGINAGNPPYPLIVKYSPDGKVLTEFFSTALLKDGEKSVAGGSQNGKDQMFIAGDKLILYLSVPNEVFQFSLNGVLASRFQLGTTLTALSFQLGYKNSAKLLQLSVDNTGKLFAQVSVRGDKPDLGHSIMIGLSSDGSKASMIEERVTRLLGMASDGKQMYLDYDATTKTSQTREQ